MGRFVQVWFPLDGDLLVWGTSLLCGGFALLFIQLARRFIWLLDLMR
jgi:hypothetical protein